MHRDINYSIVCNNKVFKIIEYNEELNTLFCITILLCAVISKK